jgi:hypothetical protein
VKHKTLLPLTILIGLLMAVTSCQTPSRAIRPGAEIDPTLGYICIGFRGSKAELELVELTERVGRTLHLRNTDKIQLVPITEGDYAVYSMTGEGTVFGLFISGPAEFYFQIPTELMRIIRVRPGAVVYIGEIALEKSIDLNPFIGGSSHYTYDMVAAREQFEAIYGSDTPLAFRGFVE